MSVGEKQRKEVDLEEFALLIVEDFKRNAPHCEGIFLYNYNLSKLEKLRQMIIPHLEECCVNYISSISHKRLAELHENKYYGINVGFFLEQGNDFKIHRL